MSDEKEVAQKLEEALRRYGADYGFVVTDKSVRKLIDGSAYATVEVKDCTPKKLAEAFMEVGKVIEQSDDGMECVASWVVSVMEARSFSALISNQPLPLASHRKQLHATAKIFLLKFMDVTIQSSYQGQLSLLNLCVRLQLQMHFLPI